MTQTETQGHTPGPWKVYGISGERFAVGDGVERIALISDRNQDANARLIAAAPDLLAACEKTMAIALEVGERAIKISRTSHGKFAAATVKDDSSRYIRAVKAAIALAKGPADD